MNMSWSSVFSAGVALVCIMYCTFLLSEINSLTRKLDLVHKRVHVMVASTSSSSHLRSKRSDSDDKVKTRRGPRKAKKKLSAAHYVPIATPAYIQKNFPEYDDDGWYYSSKMQGWVTKTQDFESNSSTGMLNIFDKSELTKNYRRQIQEPFKVKDHGKFIVRKPGLYLVYAQVLFNDSKPDQAVALQHFSQNRVVNEFVCFRSRDRDAMTFFRSSCTTVGLVFLKRKDYLALAIEHDHVTISVQHNMTYFGAVQMS